MANSETWGAWQLEFCANYAPLLLSLGKWFVVAALIIGALLGAVRIINAYRQRENDPDEDVWARTPTPWQTIIAAIAGLVDSLTKAPTWLAMFGGGLLLLWMAGNAVPQFCLVADSPVSQAAAGRSLP